MEDKPEGQPPPSARSDLAAAVRRAREENAERAEAVASLREIEAGRLALLESALKSVVREAPPGVDLFDLTLTQADKPRLFLDMVAFVEMARDRRVYRFFQDTVHGRVLVAESAEMGRIVSAVTNYIARRLVERERALAAARETLEPEDTAPAASGPAAWPIRPVLRPSQASMAESVFNSAEAPAAPIAAPGRRFATRFGDTLSFLLMTLGSISLILLIALALYFVWTLKLRDLWTVLLHQPPPF